MITKTYSIVNPAVIGVLGRTRRHRSSQPVAGPRLKVAMCATLARSGGAYSLPEQRGPSANVVLKGEVHIAQGQGQS